MVARSFIAYDSENLVVTSSSAPARVGNSIINNSDTPSGTVFLFNNIRHGRVTVNDTGGNTAVFDDDNPNAHVITNGAGLVANNARVEAESLITIRALDAGGQPTGPTITLTVFSQGGVTGNVWGFSSSQRLNNGTSYIKTGGNNTGSSRYDSFVTCFAAGTMIDTPCGACPIEDLRAGDRVITRNAGAARLTWIGNRRVLGTGTMAPIHFAEGVIANTAALLVSPQHRMLIEGPETELLFGAPNVLVAAKFLLGLPGVHQTPIPQIDYFHLMFDRHQIVRSNGIWSESFFLADTSLHGLDDSARHELLSLFPNLAGAQQSFGTTAEMVLHADEAALLCRCLIRTHRQAPWSTPAAKAA